MSDQECISRELHHKSLISVSEKKLYDVCRKTSESNVVYTCSNEAVMSVRKDEVRNLG